MLAPLNTACGGSRIISLCWRWKVLLDIWITLTSSFLSKNKKITANSRFFDFIFYGNGWKSLQTPKQKWNCHNHISSKSIKKIFSDMYKIFFYWLSRRLLGMSAIFFFNSNYLKSTINHFSKKKCSRAYWAYKIAHLVRPRYVRRHRYQVR